MRPHPLLITVAALSAPQAWPAEPTKYEEIDFLIAAVENFDGRFIRNGKEHTAREAADHLRMKRSQAGDRIKTAEQFIEGIASKSSITGQPYQMRLADGRTVPAGVWLTTTLARHRLAEQR